MKRVKNFLKRLWNDERIEFSREVSHKEKEMVKLETETAMKNYLQL